LTAARAQRFALRGARILDPAAERDETCDVFIADGRIKALGAVPEGFHAGRELDARQHWLLPGLVDLAARLREPGQAHKATIRSESRAAVSAGITTLATPPDTDPAVDNPSVVDWIRRRAEALGLCRVQIIGGLTRNLDGKHMAAMGALKDSGCAALSNGRQPVPNAAVMRRLLEYAATAGLCVWLHPLDESLAGNGCAHEGAVATRMGLPGIPETAETACLARDLTLVEQTGARAHFCRLSSARGAAMIAEAKQRGLPVTADVAAHQLFLTEHDLAGFNPACHLRPPLRTAEDRDGLRAAVRNGTIDAICSDHQPHEEDAKVNPFPLTEPGISSLETLLPLALELTREKILTPLDMASRICSGPARILGAGGGSLEVGAPADLCLVAPEALWELQPDRLLSAGKNTPFTGHTFPGRATHTWVGGRLVHGEA